MQFIIDIFLEPLLSSLFFTNINLLYTLLLLNHYDSNKYENVIKN